MNRHAKSLLKMAEEFAHSLRAGVDAPPIDRSDVESLLGAASEIERLEKNADQFRAALRAARTKLPFYAPRKRFSL